MEEEELETLEFADDEELATPEPAGDEELETLEPADDESPVTVSLGPADEDGWDLRFTVTVPAMEKDAIAGAVEGPLARAARGASKQLRWQRVAVEFQGDALIPSAIKAVVARALAPVKPLRVIVQRGYPNEIVHEDTMPTVRATTDLHGHAVRVSIDTGDLDPADLPGAMQPELARLGIGAHGRQFSFAFSGNVRPDAEVNDLIRVALSKAGAVRAVIADEEGAESVLFDRELETRVRIEDRDGNVAVTVSPAEDPSVTAAALGLVLRGARERIGGRSVEVRFDGHAARPEEVATLLELAAALKPQQMELARADGTPDLLWPRLLRVAAKGDRILLGVQQSERDDASNIAAFQREVAKLVDTIGGKQVTVDWPAGFAFEAEVERRCIDEALGPLAPKSVACTFGGEQREPFLPSPVTFRTDSDGFGELRIVRVDTDAGKPAELARAIERRLARAARGLRDQRVRVEIAGSGALSRTMQRTLYETIEHAGTRRLELDDHGTLDVVFPSLLTIERTGEKAFQITADATDRDDAQLESSMQRELDAAEIPEGSTVRVAPSALADRLVERLVELGATRVVVDGEPPVQVHPALFAAPVRDGDRLRITADPGSEDELVLAQVEHELPGLLAREGQLADVDVTLVWPGASQPYSLPLSRTIDELSTAGPRKLTLDAGDGHAVQLLPEVTPEYVTVLGRNDGATPPLLLLGVDQGSDDEHLAAIGARLDELRPDIEGRRVLILVTHHGREFAANEDLAVVQAAREKIDGIAAATLLRRRDHFEVVHSTLESLATGTKVRDPRPGR